MTRSVPVWRATLAASILALAACQSGETSDAVSHWTPEVVARYPHDPNAFTQGLLFHDGKLYESTGRRGQSSLRRIDVETGAIERIHRVSAAYFAEGLALVDDRLFQLTWELGTAFVYRLEDFALVRTYVYEGEGWGLTFDGESLIMSDGSATLRFIDPADFSLERIVTVTDGEQPVRDLNELEYIDGEVWANVWYEDRLVRIDPDDGRVLGWIDLSALFPAAQRPSEAVVNGIAWDADDDRIFVTGKLWPAIFEIRLPQR